MMRTPLTALALTAALALPAAAEMTDAERADFRAEVRAYLLDNPEVLMEAIAVLDQRQAEQQVAGDKQLLSNHADAIYNDGFSWVGGNPDGDVTIVEFMDYRCGYCKKAQPEVAELLARDGNIRLIVKEFPILGEESVIGSRFAIATKMVAGDEAYGVIHDALMTMRGDMSPDTLKALADENGFDGEAIIARMSDPEVTRIITANRALGQQLNINGTPSFVFGDQMVRGYVPLDAMQQLVTALREG